jgi:hypothetical protein
MAKRQTKKSAAPQTKKSRALNTDMPLDQQWTRRLVRFEGITPVIFGKPASTVTPNPRKSAALTGETDVKQVALAHLHVNEEGHPCVPAEMLWACLKSAGRHFKVGKRQLATSQTTILHFFVEITGTSMFRLANGTRDLTVEDMQVNIDNVFNQSSKMVTSYKPRFDNWSISVPFSLNISPIGGLTLSDYQDIFRIAGMGYGIGSRRPERGGNNGKFRFDGWKEI